MCSTFKFGNCMGRNFDYEVSYREEIQTVEPNEYDNKYKVLGMTTGIVDYPLLYDGINQHGLACSALAFTGNAKYGKDENGKLNVPAYNLVFYILGNYKSVSDLKKDLKLLNITDTQFSEQFPNSDLHWFVADSTESVVIEQIDEGLKFFSGDVMTNNPTYANQLESCSSINANIGESDFDNAGEFYTRGLETSNLSGDYTSSGRFSRLTYLKAMLEKNNDFDMVANGFHLLSSVEQIYGATPVGDDFEYTIYSIVYDMENLKAYLRFYNDLNVEEFSL